MDSCPYCGRKYVYAARLITHVKREHRELYEHFTRTCGSGLQSNHSSDAHKWPRLGSEEPQPDDSDEEYDSDCSTDDREDLNPRDGDLIARQEKTQTDAGKTYDVEIDPEKDTVNVENPWDPFTCEEDYCLGK